ncbi:hypothetical protein DSL72_005411 [Monilinia vaccinii-corymbosi]|uniref:Glucose-methanol-choline oxidoreductase N-terminal domain-containing protein n=1 Tax=Monilinia vaccinii-corymbosi TaxID=61207 RepID=A0A8A3PFA3_9HELO|nr:hypothetical protein DSL72_005411 [Monilinia vaccinii-corymbosi]
MSTLAPQTVDIIFAGGGTAACVAAGRLARANPALRILVIESGKNNFEDPMVVTPALYLSLLTPDNKAALFYQSKASAHLKNRAPIVTAGGILGGGSSINFMMYSRAQSIDFASWDTPGWSAEEMWEVHRKLETYHPVGAGRDPKRHGYEGLVNVGDGPYRGKSEDVFLETVKGMGYREIVDLQDGTACGGFSKSHRYVSPAGRRQDAAHTYIHPLLQSSSYPNLQILPESKVVRVLFDTSSTTPRATGVEYIPNSEHQPAIALSKPVLHTVTAEKYVVVSAGALGTPQILERSGVGRKEVLDKVGVQIISEVDGVGEAYQDHNLLLYPYKTSLDESETIDNILSGRKDLAQALEAKDPQLGWNSIGPDFVADWNRDFAPYPTKPLMLCAIINAFLGDLSLVEPGQYITTGTYTAYPYSRGSIHITSPSDVQNGYEFDAGFLSHPSDLKKQVWAYKMQREICRRLPYVTGELAFGHPKFAEGSKAAAALFAGGSGGKIEDVEYSAEDDAVIEDWIRENLATTWHSLGTCAMRPWEKGGVVDGSLNVYGTQGLKICDLSMVPENVGSNTNCTALAVGEKAAMIIGRELGIEV